MVLIGVACGTGAGAWLASTAGERLTVTVEVLVKPLTHDPRSDPGRPVRPLSMDNEARVVASDAVLRQAQAALPDHPSLGELRRVTVDVVPGSTIMEIGVTTTEADISRDRAHAIATSYLAHRADDARRQAALEDLDPFQPDPGTILRGPSPPRHAGPPAPLTLVGGALVGMLLGVTAATLRARHIDSRQVARAAPA